MPTPHKIQSLRFFPISQQAEFYLLFFSLLRLTNAMIKSATPAHSHIIASAVCSAKNQAGDKTSNIIAIIKISLLLIIILHSRVDQCLTTLAPHKTVRATFSHTAFHNNILISLSWTSQRIHSVLSPHYI